MAHYREEVFNVYLAELLKDRGIVSVPESIARLGKQRKMPDVLVEFYGLRVMIEGKVSDAAQAHTKGLDAARGRIEQGIAQIGVAVIYPAALRNVSDVKSALANADLDIAIVTESLETDYVTGDVDYLKNALTAAFEHLVEEDVVAKAVARLDAGNDRFAGSVVGKAGVIQRLGQALGITIPSDPDDRFKYVSSVAHVSGLVITNAMIFEEVLADYDPEIIPLRKLEDDADVIGAFADHWKTIISDIDYYPIFYLAREILLSLPSGQDIDAFKALIDTAKAIVRNKAALRHDLMGRVYHRLLADAKYLGTYYTSIPAATLLLRLALRADDWKVMWSDLGALAKFKVGDLACGTGTLLMAGADALADNYITATVAIGEAIEPGPLHKVLTESVIHGYDVLASAIHLTASTLAMRAPEVAFEKMNLFTLPLGGADHSLGSIEFLRKGQLVLDGFEDMFGAMTQVEQVGGMATETVQAPRPPQLHLCVMNPPFTRSVGGNLLFGSSPEAERREMQKELKKLLRKHKVLASVTAGLGSVFVAIGDKYLRPGGRLALVLPKALISGVAWNKTRDLFRQGYEVEYIIASQDPTQWNFSESTSLSEVLLVARKAANEIGEPTFDEPIVQPDGKVVTINLWRNPQTAFEALAMAQDVMEQKPPDVMTGEGAVTLKIGSRKMGEALAFTWDDLRDRRSWMLPCAFAQSSLIRSAYHLLQGHLWLPGQSDERTVPLVPLKSLGVLGPDRRDIYDGFDRVQEKTAYPAFWGHKADEVQTLAQSVTDYLSPLAEAKKGRPLRTPEQLWPKAGCLLLAERLWLNTMRMFAVRLAKPVLSNVWWSFAVRQGISQSMEKSLALWLNSTLGLLILLASRDETRGAWVDFKKPSLRNLPVLEVQSLQPSQRRTLADAYDRLADQALRPFPEIAEDPVRAQIDAAITEALTLPDITILRELLAQEPVVCLRPLV